MVTQPLPASVPANPPELPAVVAAPVHAQVAAAVLPALAVPVQPVLAAPAAMPAADAAARAQHMARLRSQFNLLSRIANCPNELRKPLLAEWEFKSNEQKARHAELDALALGDALVVESAVAIGLGVVLFFAQRSLLKASEQSKVLITLLVCTIVELIASIAVGVVVTVVRSSGWPLSYALVLASGVFVPSAIRLNRPVRDRLLGCAPVAGTGSAPAYATLEEELV